MTRDFAATRSKLSDAQALTCTLYGEAAGEPVVGQVAVAWVIKNRAARPGWWGKTIAGVCLAPSQFSCWWEFRLPNTQRLYAVANALLDGAPPPDAAIVAALERVAASVLAGTSEDPTNGATHYVTTALLSAAPPKWARGRRPCAILGRHTFFKDVG